MSEAPALRCAPAAQQRRDQLPGTAAPVLRWLLVEHPGAWGRDALRESHLDGAVVRDLAARSAGTGLRVLLVRRPGRRVQRPLRHWAVVDSRPGSEGVRWGSFTTDAELYDVPLDEPVPPGADPLYLVCTHARHDPCCAMRGRPLVAALGALRPGQAWECSHVGGDRFAGNLVVLPHGLYYGHVSPEQVGGLVEAYEAGEVEPAQLRGRSAFPAVVQVAQHHARLALDLRDVEALPPESVTSLGDATWRVTLSAGGAQAVATVRVEADPDPVRLTCHSAEPERRRIYRLLDLDLPGPR